MYYNMKATKLVISNTSALAMSQHYEVKGFLVVINTVLKGSASIWHWEGMLLDIWTEAPGKLGTILLEKDVSEWVEFICP